MLLDLVNPVRYPARRMVAALVLLLASDNQPQVRTRLEELALLRRQMSWLVLAGNRSPNAQQEIREKTHKERLERELAERGPVRLNKAQPWTEAGPARAAVKDWASF